MTKRDYDAIVLFDGVCNFCNQSVRFIIDRDRRGRFRFASLQSDAGRNLLSGRPDARNIDSIVLIENGQYFTESSAVLRIAGKLDGWWKAARFLLVVPKFLRDPVYRYVAKRRYRWFGKQDSCMVPTKEVRDRFLSAD